VQYNTALYTTTQQSAIQHSTIHHKTTQCNTIQHYTQHNKTQYTTAGNSTIQCRTRQYNTKECNTIKTVPYNTTQCNTRQYYKVAYKSTVGVGSHLTAAVWDLFCFLMMQLPATLHLQPSRYDSVSIATASQSLFHVFQKRQTCPFSRAPWRAPGPPSLLFNGHRCSFPGVKRPGREVDDHLHLVPMLRMSGAIRLLP
jgi:hypothetical protein